MGCIKCDGHDWLIHTSDVVQSRHLAVGCIKRDQHGLYVCVISFVGLIGSGLRQAKVACL